MELTEAGRLLSGRYRLCTVIGQGGMGVVWQARDELLKRDVAVKELVWPPNFTEAEQRDACRRAVREAQMAGRLAHLNVVRIYDILEEDGSPWIIMELLPYRSLRDLVREEGPLTPARAAQVGLGVLAALGAAHAEGVLHRDVKPANVLVGPDRVVLTDFGIARAVDSPTLTAAGALVGSPSYIAPERARGGPSTPAGDLWALGASLYAAVEGHPPFERNAPLATLTAVVVDEPEQAVHAGPLWPVISALLRKDPDERPDAAETGRMLREVADHDEAAPAGPAPRRGRAAFWRVRQPPRRVPPVARPTAGTGPAAGGLTGAAGTAALPGGKEPGSEQTAADDAAVKSPASGPGSDPVAGPAAAADSPGAAVAVAPAARGAAAASPEPVTTASPEPETTSPPGPVAVSAPGPVEAQAAAADAGPPAGQRSPAAGSFAAAVPGRPRRSRHPALTLAALAALAVGATVTALVLLTSPPSGPAASPAVSPRPAGHTAGTPAATGAASASAAASAKPAAPSGSGAASAPAAAPAAPGSAGSGSGSRDGASAGYGALPAGFYRFTNSTGFSIGVPDGWQISHVGHYVYITDPSDSGIFLLIDQSDAPQANPLADWQQQAANRASGYQDYRLIRLESVSYPQAEKAADWEFTYDRDGIPVHILNRNVLANAHHAYALYWSTPESNWNASYHYFQVFAATFRPAQ